MTDPILYLSMLLGLGGVYVLITSFNDDDDDSNDDGEKYFFTVDEFNAKKNEDKKFDLVYSRDTVLHQKNPF